jgi:hypothetical protein
MAPQQYENETLSKKKLKKKVVEQLKSLVDEQVSQAFDVQV